MLQKNIKKHKNYLLFGIAMLIIGGFAFGYNQMRSNNDKTTVQQSPPAVGEEKLNLEPPTDEDAKRVDENKQKIVAQQDAQSTPKTDSSGLKSVKPVITYAGKYDQNIEVGGFVSGIFEDNGSCTLNLTYNSENVTKKVTAVKNYNSVDCPVMSIPTGELKTKGKWSATITYESTSAKGTSDSRTIEVN